MRIFFKALSILITIIILTLCSGCSDNYMEEYIYFELEKQPATLDPQLVSTRDEAVIVRCLFDTLLRYNDKGELVSSACSSYEQDGLRYTFAIREDAYWINGDKLTADDFVFAFRRAVDPVTKSPTALTLSSIKNAKEIINGTVSKNELGVYAESSEKLVIELSEEDADFLNKLTTPITMPCNEKFFNETKGKYGLDLDSVASCGSYYVRKWQSKDKDNYLIRLAKNLDYKTEFEARSMRVYFTCDISSNSAKLKDEDTDISFLDTTEAEMAEKLSIELTSIEDTLYIMFFSPSLDINIREALIKTIKIENEYVNKFFGAQFSDSIYPSCLNINSEGFRSKIPYDLFRAQEIYANNVLANPNQSLSGISIKCINNSTAIETVKTLAAHWQQKLGAFINIEVLSSLDSLNYDYLNDNYSVLVLPFSAYLCDDKIYSTQFKVNSDDVLQIQNTLISEYMCYPLFNQSSFTGYNQYITNFKSILFNGIPDIALAIKIA